MKLEEETNENQEEEVFYPSIFVRIKALIIDAFIISFGIFLTGYVFRYYEDASNLIRGIVLFSWFYLYEPLMVTTGGTPGHRISGLRVKEKANYSNNLIFPLAVLRSVVKYFFGLFSFITLLFSKNNRALHDILSGSIVIYEGQKKEIEFGQ